MKNLENGLSGCKLELLGNKIIRKYSSSEKYNSRLLKQIDKQILFSNYILKNIDTPKVYQVDKNKIYSFDMEYISGLSFCDYFVTASSSDIDFVIETLFSYFDFLISNSRKESINSKILSKISSLEDKTSYPEYLSFIRDFVSKQNIIVPKTFCHGDLTFTNILFHKNRLFFIDFLDSFIDSFICDFVKLKQDIYHLWSLEVQNINSIRIRQIYRYIWNRLYRRYYSYIDTHSFEVLDALNSLRIEPYLTNQLQRDILYKIIKKSSLYEKFNDSDGGKVF
jgi:tRNA A-37 threonylcarbamoyl transferase component Bud32